MYAVSVRSARLSRRATAWLRLAFALLSLLVALGGTLPAFARMAAGPQAHVCHCETGGAHVHCACPICFPELDDSIEARIASISGKCGEDDNGWRTLSEPAVLPAVFVAFIPVVDAVAPAMNRHDLATRRLDPPDPPPPRFLSA